MTSSGASFAEAEALVVGGGVIGLAVARALAESGVSVVLIDRHVRYGEETSSRNSEVIHAGMYYRTGSLKAELCVSGNALLYDFCDRFGVPYQRTGKLIVASDSGELVALESLYRQGEANGVPGLHLASDADIRRLEPNVRGFAAIVSDSTGVVDSHQFIQALARLADTAGAVLARGVTLVSAERSHGGWCVTVRDSDGTLYSLRCECVVNAAGLDADVVAEAAGMDADALGIRTHWWWGHYYRMSERWRDAVTRLVYPLPYAGLAGLGVHLTRDLSGGMKLGPDSEYRPERRQDYGFRRDSRAEFAAAACRYLPGIVPEDLRPDQVGIRPKLTLPTEPARDFVVREEGSSGFPGWINLAGIESPGLTCVLPLAALVDRLVAQIVPG